MEVSASPIAGRKHPWRPSPFGVGRLSHWRIERAGAEDGTLADPVELVPVEADGVPVLEVGPDGTAAMRFGRMARFGIDFVRRVVTVLEMHPQVNGATLEHLLHDHVAPRIIAKSGQLVLHGSAVEIDGQLILFIGETGSGKSTLAAFLHTRGHRLLGDDAVVISETGGVFHGEAVYPSLRLFPESIAGVFGEPIPTEAMAFYSDKRHVTAFTESARASQHFPLALVYVLAGSETGIEINRFTPADACMVMIEHSFAFDPQDAASAARRLIIASRLAARVPCHELAFPNGFDLLRDIEARILAALHQVAAPPQQEQST